jgi:hypothetical protein
MPLIDTDRLLSFADYAKRLPNRKGELGVTVSYVHQLLKAGKLPADVKHHIISGIHFVELLPKP